MNKITQLLGREKGNTKINKNAVPTAYLALAPHTVSGYNVCPMATDGCSNSCVAFTGMAGIYKFIMERRIEKTRYFMEHRRSFLFMLRKELAAFDKYCEKRGVIGRCRLNTFSDINWAAILKLSKYKNIRFYDYTKVIKYAFNSLKPNSNYNVIYSWNEKSNLDECRKLINAGGSVAVVFGDVEYQPAHNKIGKLPEYWNGFKVIDGDMTDDRFDDKGVIVGLRLKGIKSIRKNAVDTGFAQSKNGGNMVGLTINRKELVNV